MKSKLQAPRSKLQGSFTNRRGASVDGHLYPEPAGWSFQVSEGADDNTARHPFDLEERTAEFGEAIIRFVKKMSRGPHNDRLIDQLVGCGTSVGANYCEANEGVSKKDFHCIVGRCRKEAKEAKFFLRMIATAAPELAPEARVLFREARELHLIFCAIFRNSG